jgi:hypothetical protein
MSFYRRILDRAAMVLGVAMIVTRRKDSYNGIFLPQFDSAEAVDRRRRRLESARGN